MAELRIPSGYRSMLSIYDTQRAIEYIKHIFQHYMKTKMNLKRVSAPLFVEENSGLNDNLNGYERPVSFDIPDIPAEAQVVHSLAKWKRLALKRYDFYEGNGLYTDMNAIRRDEELDNLHSVYVDQWDWERVITAQDRNLDYLKNTVRTIVDAICDTNELLKEEFPLLHVKLDRNVFFITTQELEDMYPDKTPHEREDLITKEHHTVFLMQIGDKLKSGKPHDGRAPDYDDWQLNGDILFYNEVLDSAFEISSMGIRVDKDSMISQLEKAGCMERKDLMFHKMLLDGELPLTIGGGIGQSRLCMLLMQCAHIGEVQAGIWKQEDIDLCEQNGIHLL
ncbi:MAG: aspartate--ammonia ligase [Clostridia bacterium]|nr:aspartate--ammonia ligase [Clostridia bacterium]